MDDKPTVSDQLIAYSLVALSGAFMGALFTLAIVAAL